MGLKETIAAIAPIVMPGGEAWLVGGTVRDIQLGRDTVDVDIAVPEGAEGFARRAADTIGGTSFVLDVEREIYRAAKAGFPYHMDVSRLRGGIEEDLALRDFTINAMAVRIAAGGEWEVSDPLGGKDDLDARLIRAVSVNAFRDDPVRLLRAFRLSCQLGFDIEKSTIKLIREQRSLIKDVSPERVRDELYLILEEREAAASFRQMYQAGPLPEVIPELSEMDGVPQSGPHENDVLEHSFRAMQHAGEVMDGLEKYFSGRATEIGSYLEAPVDGLLRMSGLVRLCSLLHDSGKPRTLTVEPDRIRFTGHDLEGEAVNLAVAQRLRFSGRASRTLGRVTRAHLRPLHLTKGPLTRHAMFRYVRDVGEDVPASLIVALADALATRERAGAVSTDVEGLVGEVAQYYYGEYMRMKEQPLITGDDLVDVLGLKPGPLFGAILKDVEEKRAEGALSDREGAIEYVRENYS